MKTPDPDPNHAPIPGSVIECNCIAFGLTPAEHESTCPVAVVNRGRRPFVITANHPGPPPTPDFKSGTEPTPPEILSLPPENELPKNIENENQNSLLEPPPGVAAVLLWAENLDEDRNTHFEAITHFTESAFWRVSPTMEENRVFWHLLDTDEEIIALTKGIMVNHRFETPDDAKAAAQQWEIAMGGAEKAPRVPMENPDQTPPHLTDSHGFAPTREIRSRWSRNGGVLYLARVWKKVENPAIEKLVDLHDAEYEAALEGFATQHLMQSLVSRLTQGWTVPLKIEQPAIGLMVLECEVHFVGCVRLQWSPPAAYKLLQKAGEAPEFRELVPPSHERITMLVAEQLLREKKRFEKELDGKTEADLRREIVRKARALGMKADDPEPETEGGGVLPITLEHMQNEGVDLKGRSLKRDQP
jgi:hypothetical protein